MYDQPLSPNQPDDAGYGIVKEAFAVGYHRAMLDAMRFVERHSTTIGHMLSLEIRTDMIEAAAQGGEVHDAIMRTQEAAARVLEQTAADNLAARTRMVTQDAPDVTDSPARQEDAHEQDACGADFSQTGR